MLTISSTSLCYDQMRLYMNYELYGDGIPVQMIAHAIHTPQEDKWLDQAAEERKALAAQGDPDAMERQRIWEAIVEASRS